MKRLFIAALFAAGISSALVSCNNGNYDADPKTDNSKYKNPLDPSSGVHVYIGTIKANLSFSNGHQAAPMGKDVLFVNAYYMVDSNGARHLYATQTDDPVFQGAIEMFWAEQSYRGPNTYAIGGGDAGWEFIYTMKDTSFHNRNVRKTYWAGHPGIGKGLISFVVKGEEGGNLRGTFTGSVNRATIDQDYLFDGKSDSTDVLSIFPAEFYVPRK